VRRRKSHLASHRILAAIGPVGPLRGRDFSAGSRVVVVTRSGPVRRPEDDRDASCESSGGWINEVFAA
jgi:hypothetical protein